MPTNKHKEENERLRAEAERLRVELVRLSQKVEIALAILQADKLIEVRA